VSTSSERELSLPDTVSELNASNGDGSVGERLEARHGCTASFDRPVILFDDVVEILVGPDKHIAPA
jgi:hypothetical protein